MEYQDSAEFQQSLKLHQQFRRLVLLQPERRISSVFCQKDFCILSELHDTKLSISAPTDLALFIVVIQ